MIYPVITSHQGGSLLIQCEIKSQMQPDFAFSCKSMKVLLLFCTDAAVRLCVCVRARAVPITDSFMEPALVLRHHKPLMTSLFLQLETLPQFHFRLLLNEKSQEQHPLALAD